MERSDYVAKTLRHPAYRKGVSKKLPNGDWQGEPDIFPPVTVNSPEQEAFHRAKGYLGPNERPASAVAYAEYPVMLYHPDFVEAVPTTIDIQIIDGKQHQVSVAGKPAVLPPQTAASESEELALNERGYRRVSKSDPDAVQRAKSVPFDPDFSPEEYPKMVDGVIVDPHNEVTFQKYPMCVGDQIVNNAAEERAARAKQKMPVALDKCVICGNDIQEGEKPGSGPLGKFHLSHVTQSYAPEPDTSAKRAEAGKRAAETRAARRKRLAEPANATAE